jgi:hypothetical protein
MKTPRTASGLLVVVDKFDVMPADRFQEFDRSGRVELRVRRLDRDEKAVVAAPLGERLGVEDRVVQGAAAG